MSEQNNETCAVVRDLMPLMLDGVASAQSEAFARRHMESCEDCRAAFARLPEDIARGQKDDVPPMRDVMRALKKQLSLRVVLVAALTTLMILAVIVVLFYCLTAPRWQVPCGELITESVRAEITPDTRRVSVGLREEITSAQHVYYSMERAQEDGKLLNLYVSTKASWASHLRSTINPWADHTTLDIDLGSTWLAANDTAPGAVALKLGEDAVVEAKPYEDDCVVAAVYFCGGEFGDEDKTVLLWEAKPEQYPLLTLGALNEMGIKMNQM